MPTSPPFLRPLNSAERNPQKGAADDVGAEDQHPDQQSRFHLSGPAGGARSAARPNTRDWLNVGLRDAAPGGRLGALHRRGPGQLRLRSREPPNWYVVRCSNEVQLRVSRHRVR
jgi:hypothetical protein